MRLLLPLLLAVVLLADGPSLPAVALVAAALVACAVVAARSVPAVPPTRVRTALRERDRRTAFLPQRDPDASGRRRPRAPGHRRPAAVAHA
ncbi:DUF6412 domain-containing protein [Streptomyces changanensis]|uniref:Uncharacterized protein n=2 Tax=Streptomyces TaxID=1883 RepID=A0A124EC82_9ACTN|nr:hypothetical protein ATE80_21700 [Streptomyces kanasensis]